jgi:pimeloyl-ACP methyl ester carboxylesterase
MIVPSPSVPCVPSRSGFALRDLAHASHAALLCTCSHAVQLLRGTEKYVDSLRVEVLAGCSHWAQQDRPAEVNKLLADFLRH